MSTLTDRLKEKRKEYKLTQQAVADKLGITQSTYAYYETGRNEPDIEMLKRLADVFQTSIDFLVGHD